MEQVKIFVSYAHDDEDYFKDFTNRLRKGARNTEHFTWSLWDDRDIHIGSFWDDVIQKNIQGCDIALLLVSMSFMASNYIKEHEFEAFKRKYAEKGILVVPIVLAPCDFQRWEDLAKIQFFKPKGSDYGEPTVPNFTYADLLKFRNDGTVSPNPNADRFVLDLVKKIESSYKDFLDTRDDENIVINISSITSVNKLSDAPSSRPYFVGRENEIEEFKNAIDNQIRLIAIDGPGGIGKTQFISRCIEKFVPAEKVIWYDCNTASQLDTLISEAGYPELLKGSSKSDQEKFSAFKNKIQDNGFFLFLDNFQETNINPVFRNFLIFIQNHLKDGCVIVIDRDDIRSADLTPKAIHIGGFSENKLEYAKALIDHSYKTDVKISDEALDDLCDELHGYPLVIDFAILLLSQGESPADIITKIVQQGVEDNISERLLNAIFSRSDASQEERDFITQFSVFSGSVPHEAVEAVIPINLLVNARRRLQQKNLLTYSSEVYSIHPIVKEFCYEKLKDKEAIHLKVSEYYLAKRNDIIDPILEEQIFYHLSQGNQWQRISSEIEKYGRQFILQGQLGLARGLLDRLKKNGFDRPIFSILRGDIAEVIGNWEDAQLHFDDARHNGLDEKVRVEGIIKYGEMLHRKGNVKDALLFYKDGYQLSIENDFLEEKARATNDIGLVHHWFGEDREALVRYNEALAIRNSINDKEGVSTCLLNIGASYDAADDYDQALKFYRKSLDICNSIGDIVGAAIVIRSIGSVYLGKKKYEIAISNFEKSLNISEKIGNKISIASALSGIGRVYRLTGRLDLALLKYKESLKIGYEIGDRETVSMMQNNIAFVYQKQGKFEAALELYEKCLAEENTWDSNGMADTLHNIGSIYIDGPQKDINRAIFYLLKAAAYKSKFGTKGNLAITIRYLVEVREMIGLSKFKESVNDALNLLDSELQKYIPIKELLKEPITNSEAKIGRNDPCPCGSGKKYKQCHGKSA